jgi:hypothetical protein
MVKWVTILFGGVPVLGWLVSIPWNWLTRGTPFTGCGEWNNLPLWFVTLPCWPIADFAFRNDVAWLREHRYACVILYTVICTIFYALAGYLLARFVRLCMTWNRSR